MPAKKTVLQTDLNGIILNTYSSATEAADAVGGSPSPIIQCCRQKKNISAYGYKWYYKENEKDIRPAFYKLKRPVRQFTLEGQYIKTYDSITSAAKAMHTDSCAIGNCCKGKTKTCCGYQWKFADNSSPCPVVRREITHKYSKIPVLQFDKQGRQIARYENASAAAKATSKSGIPGNIAACCKGTRHTAYGYLWRYETDKEGIQELKNRCTPKKKTRKYRRAIRQYDRNGVYLATFACTEEAARLLYPDRKSSAQSLILQNLKKKTFTACKCFWRYADEAPAKNLSPDEIYRSSSSGQKAVCQYTLKGRYLKTYSSLGAAAKALNKDVSCIQKCCAHSILTAYGYLWTYLSDNPEHYNIAPASPHAKPRKK